ncbi:MAG TPA: MFS transporter [Mycobacteriales bacterium]|nr:MFS transporter [Mycobacteriales bacterium]
MSESVGTGRRATFRDVLAIHEFRSLYLAQTLSVAGDQLARIAVAWIVYQRTHSPFLTGVSYAVTYLPWLIGGPLGSVYADRYPRRTVMIICDALRMLLVLCVAIPRMPTASLLVLVTLVACLEPPFAASRAALVPEVVGEGDAYVAAATLGNSTNQLAVVLGFALGGALVAFVGPHTALVVDAVTFALSGLVASRYVAHRPAAMAARSRWRSEISDGARVVFGDSRLRWLVVTSWIVVGTVIATEAVAVPYAHADGHGAFAAGLLSAAAPLGMVIGTLLMGRAVRPEVAERLMLPTALLTPALLALTAANFAIPATLGLWCVAGAASAMTVIANRVFVVAVPHELRGRAFGIAAAGISGSYGVGTLLAGLLTAHVGPAHAVADIALPAFALIVVFSVGSATFRQRQLRSISELSPPEEDEDSAMPALKRRSEAQVWALNVVLAAIACATAPILHGDHAYAGVILPSWWVLCLFVLGIAFPLRFEYRQQSWNIYLETVPFVLGLLFLSPLMLLALRTGAVVITYAILRRQPLIRSVFNTASYACHTLAAIWMFRLVAPVHAGAHPSVWPAVFAAVIFSELVAGSLVALVISLTDTSWQLKQSVRTAMIGTGVATAMAFLGLAMAAAIDYDEATAWAITVFVVLTIAGLQTYQRLSERANALDRLYVVARELSPTATGPADLAPALTQLRRIIKADSLELAAPSGNEGEFATVVTVFDDPLKGEGTTVSERPIGEGFGAASDNAATAHWYSLPGLGRPRRAHHALSAPVRASDRVLGELTVANRPGESAAFERGDLRLLEAAADQLAAALEKGRLVESLRRAATLDKLTGLANLESLRSFLDTTLDGSAGGVLVLLNIDRFHEVNDMLGHDAGDSVLAEVARRLESSPTHGALVARVGGDQFALAIPGAAGSEVARLAAMAVKSRVDGSIRFADVSADVRVTLGIARAPDHGSDAATLLRRAEMAMTAAKGSNAGIGEWEPDYERDGSRRLQLLAGLRNALGDGALRVAYQPKLRLGSGEVTGFEALVRWNHPELGPISPAEFVPLAEATGLISALTSTVLRSALTTCRSWHDAGKPVGIAVNISARSLDDSVLVGQVAAMLTASGLEPRWLTLEITESSVMEDQSRSVDVLRELRMLGVRLSIDDFGTGYSSLHQLRGLPVHEVKIDRTFVETVDSDEADRAVVRAVVELCDSLGLVTVAEGVEKAAQAYALETLGVAQVQGYFHGRPMTEAAAMEWLLPRRVATFANF